MATNGNRDVVLTVEAKALGGAGIKALAAEVRTLGKSGTDAAPEFERLAAELDRLDDSAGAVIGLRTLETAVTELSAAQAQAASSAKAAGDTFDKLKADNDALRASVAASTAAWNEARQTQIGNREALQKLTVTTANLTAEEKASNVSLKIAKNGNIEATAEVRRRKIALDEAKAALSAVVSEETNAEAATRKTSNALKAAESNLLARTEALNAARGVASALGVETSDLAAAEARLNAQLTDTSKGAEKLQAHVAALVEMDQQALQVTQRLADALKRNAQGYEDSAAAALAAAQAQARVVATQQAAAAEALQFVLGLEKTEAAAKAAADRLLEIDRAANKLKSDALYVREFAAALDAADAAAAKAAAETKRLADSATAAREGLAAAFSQAGVRSIQAIQTEITQTTAALRTLEAAQKAGAISATDLARATGSAQARLQALGAEIRTMPAATGVLERMNDTVLGLVNRFGALSAAVATVGFAAAPILEANLQLDSMRRILTQVYGSAAEAGKQIDFVRRVAESAGVDVKSAGESFTRFASSARASGLDTELVQKVFEATANAAGNLGLSSDKTRLILDALGQMANKGTVSMEELRQQLGDSLPGALSLLAKGLRITEPQLVKLVESGGLLTSQALGPLAEAMATLAAPGGRVESLGASLARLRNEFTLALQSISDTAGYRLFGQVVAGLADNFGTLTTGVKLLTEAFLVSKVVTVTSNFISLRLATTGAAVAAGEAAAATVLHTGAIARDTVAVGANTAAKVTNAAATVALTTAAGGNAAAWAAVGTGLASMAPKAAQAAEAVGLLARAKSAAGAAAGRLVGALGGPIGALVTFALVAKDLGQGIGALIAKMAGFGDRSDEIKAKLAAVAKAHAENQKAVDDSAASWVQATVRYAEALVPLEKNIEASTKLQAAKRLEGEASVRVAELAGDEARKLDASTTAAEGNAAASRLVAIDKAKIVVESEALLEVYAREEAARGKLSAAEEQARDKLADTIKVQRAAASEARAFADAQDAVIDSTKLAAAAHRDNSGQVAALEAKYRQAADAVTLMQLAQRRGEATQDSVNQAITRAGVAQGLYKDALKDGAAAGVDFRQVQTGVSDAFFAQSAGLHGVITSLGEYGATAERASPQLSAAFDKQLALAKTREELEFLSAEVAYANKLGLLFGDTYATQLDRIKSKTLELNPVMAALRAEAKRLGVELAGVAGSTPASSLTNADGTYRTASVAANAGPDAPAKSQDPYGRTAYQQQLLAQQGAPVDASYQFTLRDRLQKGDTFAASELPAIENALAAARANARAISSSSVQSLTGNRDAAYWVNILTQVAGSVQAPTATPSGVIAGAPQSVGNAITESIAASQASTSHTVQINLPSGAGGTIKLASATDASNLVALLSKLQQDAARAGG